MAEGPAAYVEPKNTAGLTGPRAEVRHSWESDLPWGPGALWVPPAPPLLFWGICQHFRH